MSVDQCGGEAISGGNVVRSGRAKSRAQRRRYWNGYDRPRTPEEPTKTEDGNRGGSDDDGRAGTGHCLILVLFRAPRKPLRVAGVCEVTG